MNVLMDVPQAAEGAGLAFIVYSEAIKNMPVPQLWSVLYFSMLLMLGVGSMLGNVMAITTSLHDCKFLSRRLSSEALNGEVVSLHVGVGLFGWHPSPTNHGTACLHVVSLFLLFLQVWSASSVCLPAWASLLAQATTGSPSSTTMPAPSPCSSSFSWRWLASAASMACRGMHSGHLFSRGRQISHMIRAQT